MTKESIPKSQLLGKLRERDVALGYGESTRKKRACTLSRLLQFMNLHNLDEYNQVVGGEFSQELLKCDDILTWKKNESLRLISILDSICTDTPTPVRRTKVSQHPLFGTMASLAEDYLKYLRDVKRLSSNTISKYRMCLSRFTQKMTMSGITWDTLKYNDIIGFLVSHKNTTASVYANIRSFINFAYAGGYIQEDFSILLKSVKPHRKESLPSCYTPEEVMRVENAVDRRSSIGKRDYAIILLASRLGLRSSDIRLLEFKNIDWDRNEINIIQYKTKKELTLPLLSDVGEAIIDYVKNGRPTSSLRTIFLTCSHPYKVCNPSTISSIVKRYYVLSGVDHKGKHVGPHSLRHSFATAMLCEGTSLPIISGALGHSSAESTMYYLGVDIDSLLKCSIDVPPVDESFYTQKGGVLYE